DYNAHFDPSSYPTPTRPADAWDSWAQTYGYPYRGQPSMVYALPFRLEDSQQKAVEPVGYGDLHGLSGELSALDDRITNDPMGAPGSGADRLRIVQEARLSLDVIRCQERGPGASQPEAVQALRV